MGGHVVVSVDGGQGNYWLLDPDYGVVIDKNIQEVENNPEIIKQYYANHNDETINSLVGIYGKENNKMFSSAIEYCGDRYNYEKMSYLLMWIIPLLLVLPFILYCCFSRLPALK